MSAKERMECPGCQGTGVLHIGPNDQVECPLCHGIGTVLAASDQLGTSEREDMEGKLKKLRESNEALRESNEVMRAENVDLLRRCQEQEQDLQRLRGRLEMVYLIFGGEPND